MNQRDDDMLTAAIERNSAAVLSLPSAGMFRYHATRFLRAEGNRMWLDSVAREQPLIESLIAAAAPVTVSFKISGQQVSFTQPIIAIDNNYRFFGAQESVQALLMRRPETAKAEQRRNHYRVPVNDEDRFTISLWRIADVADLKVEPSNLTRLSATVRDLSVGGVGVIFPTRPNLVPETRLRVLLRQGNSPEMLLDARSGPLRQIKNTQAYETGLQFQNLQNNLTGRQLLTDLNRMVIALQLNQAKKLRGKAG